MRSFVMLLALSSTLSQASQGPDTPEGRLLAKGLTLPSATSPVAIYVTSVRSGNLLYLSGHGECGTGFTTGKVGKDLTVEQGAKSAERVGLCMLATIKAALGDLSKVKRVVRILGMVNATEDFKDHPKVVNGFSAVMLTAFGDAGLAARSAVGMGSLPFGIPVEVEALVEVRSEP
jgi:enamine deaminase RidA (YjgF/YER057c/UK114 family)